MEGNDYSYGEIHVLTELVYIDPIDLKKNPMAPAQLRKKPQTSITVSVDSFLRDVDDVHHVWWPCKSFSGIYQGVVLCSFAYLVIRTEEDVTADFQDYQELNGDAIFVPWWQVMHFRFI